MTAAALILFFAFAALAGIPSTDIKVMATALGAGILLDATLIRALLVPALVSLFGRWNWWLPGVRRQGPAGGALAARAARRRPAGAHRRRPGAGARAGPDRLT